jgi:hypothetical protein
MTTMTNHCHEQVTTPIRAHADAQWRTRVLLVGGGFQVIFGAWWIVRALAPLTSTLLGVVVAVLILAGGVVVTTNVFASAPRPRGREARRIERRLSVATVLQLVVSFAVPVGFSALHVQRLTLPLVMASIGLLLIWIHREVDSPFQGTAGRSLVVLSLAALAFKGTGQTVFAGLCSATVLLACASAGYHWLEHHGFDD